jgi:hypothetical protein
VEEVEERPHFVQPTIAEGTEADEVRAQIAQIGPQVELQETSEAKICEVVWEVYTHTHAVSEAQNAFPRHFSTLILIELYHLRHQKRKRVSSDEYKQQCSRRRGEQQL